MTKHIILISDGDPAAPSPQVINQLIATKITVTTVIVAAHGNDPGSIATMRDIAVKTKGRFYQVTNPKALPRIYQKEARIISRPLIFEQPKPWLPNVKYTSEPITGLTGAVPPITGLVQTSPKESELVEVPILSPLPAEQPPPLLAHWTYGLGRSVAFTSDAGRKWTTALAELGGLRGVLVAGRPLVDEAGRQPEPHPERPPRGRARSRSSSTPWTRTASSSTSSRSRARSSAPT